MRARASAACLVSSILNHDRTALLVTMETLREDLMDATELLDVVRTEHLDTPVLDDVGDLHADAVVLERGGGVWKTYVVDDELAMITHTLRTFPDETRAHWDVLHRLRQIAEARRTGAAQPDHAGSRRSVEFAPSSMRTGAVIPGGVLSALDTRIDELATTKDRHDQWLADGAPLFSRGDAWIVPLSWEPALAERDPTEWPTLHDRAAALWRSINMDCQYFHGNALGVDLDPEVDKSGYAAELRRTGARRVDWWRFGNSALAVVLVVYGEPIPAPVTLMAVHVVPIDWVRDSARRTKSKQKRTPDLSWSWADVVEFTRVDKKELRPKFD